MTALKNDAAAENVALGYAKVNFEPASGRPNHCLGARHSSPNGNRSKRMGGFKCMFARVIRSSERGKFRAPPPKAGPQRDGGGPRPHQRFWYAPARQARFGWRCRACDKYGADGPSRFPQPSLTAARFPCWSRPRIGGFNYKGSFTLLISLTDWPSLSKHPVLLLLNRQGASEWSSRGPSRNIRRP
jgi:hypothetical protein